MLYIGIDLGTSAVKLLLMDGEGAVRNIVSKEYPLEFPHPGWSQQAPEDWRKAVLEGIPELLRGFDAGQVAGIGAGGQMHGLVALDAEDNVIRPARGGSPAARHHISSPCENLLKSNWITVYYHSGLKMYYKNDTYIHSKDGDPMDLDTLTAWRHSLARAYSTDFIISRTNLQSVCAQMCYHDTISQNWERSGNV